MKITVTNENNLTTDYTLTSNGIVGQPQKENSMNILIGRDIQSDIILS